MLVKHQEGINFGGGGQKKQLLVFQCGLAAGELEGEKECRLHSGMRTSFICPAIHQQGIRYIWVSVDKTKINLAK